MRVVVTGSHGLIGSALVVHLRAAGHDARGLERGPGWDPPAGTVDPDALDGADAVVHLAGEPLAARRWSPAQKELIRASRVNGTGALARALAGMSRPPAVLVSGSAVGWYGDRGDEVLTEDSPAGAGFLAEVCRAWEDATAPAADAGVRVVTIRTGIVLSRTGGALARQLTPFRLGVGGPLGHGRQYLSWISLDDHVGAIAHIVATPDLAGPVNLTAPEPATAREFARTLGRVLRRPALVPVPRLALGAILGRELAAELMGSQRVLPRRLGEHGYDFAHPGLEAALRQVLGR